jgi:5-methylcytosine-specific restriction endonuclease McrA
MPYKDKDKQRDWHHARYEERKRKGMIGSRAEERRVHRLSNPEYVQRESQQKKTAYYQRKQKAIALLGGKCCRCGCDDTRCLEIDHIIPVRGDRSIYGDKLYRNIISGGSTKNLQVLCANCHAIKTYEDGNGIE